MWVIQTAEGDIPFRDRAEIRQWMRQGRVRPTDRTWSTLYNAWTTAAEIAAGREPAPGSGRGSRATLTSQGAAAGSPVRTARRPAPDLPAPAESRSPQAQLGASAWFFSPMVVLPSLFIFPPVGLALLWLRPNRDWLSHILVRLALTAAFGAEAVELVREYWPAE